MAILDQIKFSNLQEYENEGKVLIVILCVPILHTILRSVSPSFRSGQRNNRYFWYAAFNGVILSGIHYFLNTPLISIFFLALLVPFFVTFLAPNFDN